MTVAQSFRALPLEGSFNLRDMGGYAAADGRAVRYRTLYRSGMMAMLTEADERHLTGIGIVTVCDLRRPGERERAPTRWCEPAGVHYWARDYAETSGVLSAMLHDPTATADTVRDAMVRLYRVIPVDHAPSYRFMFERLLGGHVPLLFNCSAGKDRTGVGAALILRALGVSLDDVVEDYLLTNVHLDVARLIERLRERGELVGKGSEDAMKPLMAADTDYLAEMFDALDRDHGGLDGYLASLGVDSAAKARLQDLLLD